MATTRTRNRHTLKVNLFGEGGVGKTTLATRIVTGEFVPNLDMTIGIDFMTMETEILDPLAGDVDDVDMLQVQLQIWDFSGQEQFRFFLDRYCQGSVAGLLLYDLSRYSTQLHIEEWLEIFRENATPGAPVMLVGSKMDLVNQNLIAEFEQQGRTLAEKYGLQGFTVVSAKTGANVHYVLEDLLESAYVQRARLEAEGGATVESPELQSPA